MSGFGFKTWRKSSGETVSHKLRKPRSIDRDKARSYLKIAIIGLFLIFIIGVVTYSPIFHSYTRLLGGGGVQDPNTIIWQATDPNNDGSELNLSGFSYRTSCKGSINCIQSFDVNKPQWTTFVGYVQCSPCAGGTTSSISVAKNDFLVVSFTVTGNGGPSGCTITPTDTLSLTWTSQQCVTIVAGAQQAIWTAKASATSGSDSVTFTGVNLGSAVQVLVTSYTGEQSIGVVANENNGGVAVNGAFTTITTITPTTSGWAVFEVLSDEDCSFNGVYSYNNGQTEVRNLGGGGGCGDTTEVSGTSTSSQNFGINANHVNSRKYNHATLIFYGSGTSSHASVAITKSQVGDLSVANSKTLGLNFTWTNPTWTNGGTFGMFLTVNATLPNTYNWSPMNDSSVIYLYNMTCTASCGTTVSIYKSSLSFLRTFSHAETIQSESSTSGVFLTGCAGSGSCFMSGTSAPNLNGNPSGIFNYAMQLLNFTGTTQSGSSCSFSGGTFGGSGCSWSNLGNSTVTRVNTRIHLPFLTLNTPVYLGFYEEVPATSTVQFGFSNLNIYTYNTGSAVAVPPSIDTGGFFGPVIKALINIGVWMLQEIVLLGTFLVAIYQVSLNAIGKFLGLGNVGDNIISFFASIGSWLVNIFGGIIGILSSFISGLSTAITSFTTWINDSVRLTWIGGFITDIGLFMSNVTTVWTDFIVYFSSVGSAINYFFFVYYCFGLYEVYFNGIDGFKSWLDLGNMFTLGTLRIAMRLFKEIREVTNWIKKQFGAPVVTG